MTRIRFDPSSVKMQPRIHPIVGPILAIAAVSGGLLLAAVTLKMRRRSPPNNGFL